MSKPSSMVITERSPETTHVAWGRRLHLPEGLPGHPGPARAHLGLTLIRDTGFLRGNFHIPGELYLFIGRDFDGQVEVKAHISQSVPEQVLTAVADLARIGLIQLEARRQGLVHAAPDFTTGTVPVDLACSGADEWGLSTQQDFFVDGAEAMESWMPGTTPFIPRAGFVYARVGVDTKGEPETSTALRTFGQNTRTGQASPEYRTGISAGPTPRPVPNWGRELIEALANRVTGVFTADQKLLTCAPLTARGEGKMEP